MKFFFILFIFRFSFSLDGIIRTEYLDPKCSELLLHPPEYIQQWRTFMKEDECHIYPSDPIDFVTIHSYIPPFQARGEIWHYYDEKCNDKVSEFGQDFYIGKCFKYTSWSKYAFGKLDFDNDTQSFTKYRCLDQLCEKCLKPEIVKAWTECVNNIVCPFTRYTYDKKNKEITRTTYKTEKCDESCLSLSYKEGECSNSEEFGYVRFEYGKFEKESDYDWFDYYFEKDSDCKDTKQFIQGRIDLRVKCDTHCLPPKEINGERNCWEVSENCVDGIIEYKRYNDGSDCPKNPGHGTIWNANCNKTALQNYFKKTNCEILFP